MPPLHAVNMLSTWFNAVATQIVFHIAMMSIQNFGFFIMYLALWLSTPSKPVCDDTRFAEGYMALTCFLVSWLCIGMGFGGYTSDSVLFPFYWVAHAAPAVLGYCVCTFLVPMARFSDTGVACAALAPVIGSAVQCVYIVHAGLFFCYVGNMLSVTYFSFLKPTFGAFVTPAMALSALALIEAVVFGALSRYGILNGIKL
jgi:hypothetical protein